MYVIITYILHADQWFQLYTVLSFTRCATTSKLLTRTSYWNVVQILNCVTNVSYVSDVALTRCATTYCTNEMWYNLPYSNSNIQLQLADN